MDNSIDDLFANSPSENEATETPVEQTQIEETPQVTETVEEPTEPAKPEPARDEQGRFTSKPTIPVEALIEERTKRQEAERQREEYERRLNEYEAQQKRSTRPDPFDNPDEYDAYVQAQIDARVTALVAQQEQQKQLQTFHNSHQKAAEELGAEAVQEALNWAQHRATTDDAWGRHALAQPDPVKFIIAQRNTHAQYEEFARDPEGFKARLLAEMSATAGATAQAQTNDKMAVKAAPKSIASAGTGNVSRPTAQTSSEAFDAMFDNRK